MLPVVWIVLAITMIKGQVIAQMHGLNPFVVISSLLLQH
jgi:hypothetical protein